MKQRRIIPKSLSYGKLRGKPVKKASPNSAPKKRGWKQRMV